MAGESQAIHWSEEEHDYLLRYSGKRISKEAADTFRSDYTAFLVFAILPVTTYWLILLHV